MATIANTFTGDGSTTNYSFTFEYLEQSEVKVTLNGVTTTDFTFANATTLSFNTAPANGVEIRIYRDTDVDTLKATFFPGSAIKAEDLNNNFSQNNFAVQELKNNVWDSDVETIKSNETWISSDGQIATTLAQDNRHSILVQTTTPTGSYQTGKGWLQNDSDLTFSVWNGTGWLGVASGGTFTNQPKVVYVDATSGDDGADGHRISAPKRTIKAAVEQINADATYGDGSVVVVAPGIYQETAPIDITKANVSIVGTALRSCIVHPTTATETNSLFRVNTGTFIQNLTFTGVKASGSLGNTVDATLPVNQGWNVSFYPGATIYKSPYIQNCTNFSDSEIDNDNINVITPAGGAAGDTDSAPTGGGLLIDGSVVASDSPLRSIVADSYTHVGLNGPGILVTNNGYTQCTSSYAFFNKYHIKTLNGGQANLAASTTDFGDEALVADGKSPTAIFSADLSTNATSGDITFTIGAPTADASWHGTSTRPQSNMLVTLNSVTYPVLSAVANGAGWDVTISRPNPSQRSENLGLDGNVTTPATASFFLRSMIASSGHTMEYVGSGTDYRALPENGGVPDDTKQIVESNNGKVWTAITDQNGQFKIGDFFTVDQRTGFINFSAGSYAFDVVTDTTPELGGQLDALTNKIVNLGTPTNASDAATKAYVDSAAGGPWTTSGSDIYYNTGDVGIGIAAPTGSLHVQRSGENPTIKVSRADAAVAGSVLLAAGSTTNSITSTGDKPFFIATNNTERLRILGNGNTGIGVTNPTEILHLKGEDATLLVQDSTNSFSLNQAGILLTCSDSGGAPRSDIQRKIKADGNALTFTYGASDTEQLRLTDGGNLGLGTDNPGTTLEVASNDPKIRLTDIDGSARVDLVGSGGNFGYYANGGGQHTWFGASDVERMRIDSSGNVGIGQSSPATSLDVDGAYVGNVAAVGASNVIDCSLGNYFTETVAGAITFSFSNVPASRSYSLTIEVDYQSGSIAWPASVNWPGGTAPTLTAGKVQLFVLVTSDSGTTWRGNALADFTT